MRSIKVDDSRLQHFKQWWLWCCSYKSRDLPGAHSLLSMSFFFSPVYSTLAPPPPMPSPEPVFMSLSAPPIRRKKLQAQPRRISTADQENAPIVNPCLDFEEFAGMRKAVLVKRPRYGPCPVMRAPRRTRRRIQPLRNKAGYPYSPPPPSRVRSPPPPVPLLPIMRIAPQRMVEARSRTDDIPTSCVVAPMPRRASISDLASAKGMSVSDFLVDDIQSSF